MKKTLLFVLFCGSVVAAAAILKPERKPVVKKITVSYDNKKQKEIPVTVTLTKFQLEKMLDMVDDEYGYGGPASPQDSLTFTSIAKVKAPPHSQEYSISSTHLAKEPIR